MGVVGGTGVSLAPATVNGFFFFEPLGPSASFSSSRGDGKELVVARDPQVEDLAGQE